MNFAHIVAAIDFSEPSRVALREAGQLASKTGAKLLTAFHIVDGDTAELYEKHLLGDADSLTEALTEKMTSWLAAEIPEAVPTRIKLVTGSPSQDLSIESDLLGGDLLVLGAHGHGGESKGRLGVVAGNLVRKASAPAFLVSRGDSIPETIVACIDYSDLSDEVMRQALDVARLQSANLEVVHAITPPQTYIANLAVSGFEPFGSLGIEPDQLEKLRRGHECQLQQFARRHESEAGGIDTTQRILEDPSPARAILDHLQTLSAPFLVLGAHGRSGFKEFLLGTAAERILHEASCSALFIREPNLTD